MSEVGRRWLLVGAAARYLIPIGAIPLVPVLVEDRLPLLFLLRPGKEFLLLGGGVFRTDGAPDPLVMLAAYVPLMVLGVWLFFFLGRAYREELVAGDGPAWLERIVPHDRLRLATAVLARRGPTIAVLGRLAALPPTVLAAAAGVSPIGAVRYLAADAVGALAAFVTTYAVGYALGDAYQRGGVWLTAAGLALFVGLLALGTRWLRREAERADGDPLESAAPPG